MASRQEKGIVRAKRALCWLTIGRRWGFMSLMDDLRVEPSKRAMIFVGVSATSPALVVSRDRKDDFATRVCCSMSEGFGRGGFKGLTAASATLNADA